MSEEIQNIDVLNKELLDRIISAQDGELTKVASAGSTMLRRRIREGGFLRQILPPKQVGNEDLTPLVDSEDPVVLEEMEPESPGSMTISFNDSADSTFYRGDKFLTNFSMITTKEYVKNVNELRTYKGDLRGVITDNALKDMQTEEDARFIATVDKICGPTAGVASPYSNQIQWIDTGAAISRDSYTAALSVLEDFNLNNGVFLMNRKTAKEFLKIDRAGIGGDQAEKLFNMGMAGMPEAKIFGVRHIFTIKRDLIPDGFVYLFAEPEYLGRFYTLEDTTMHVEKKKHILRFSADETIGVSIPNVLACAKIQFNV